MVCSESTLRGIGYVPSQVTAGTKTRRAIRAVGARAESVMHHCFVDTARRDITVTVCIMKTEISISPRLLTVRINEEYFIFGEKYAYFKVLYFFGSDYVKYLSLSTKLIYVGPG